MGTSRAVLPLGSRTLPTLAGYACVVAHDWRSKARTRRNAPPVLVGAIIVIAVVVSFLNLAISVVSLLVLAPICILGIGVSVYGLYLATGNARITRGPSG